MNFERLGSGIFEYNRGQHMHLLVILKEAQELLKIKIGQVFSSTSLKGDILELRGPQMDEQGQVRG
jgi:hypothetical protein